MNSPVRRWVLGLALVATGGLALAPLSSGPRRAAAQGAPAAGGEAVAAVEQLKLEAFKAMRIGQFDRTSELLGKAAALSHDPQVEKMASWTKSFDDQRKEFAAERSKQYDKAVGNVKALQGGNKHDYAVDAAARAFLLAPDKKVFGTETWVTELIKFAVERAEGYDKAEQWLKSLRLYSDLSSLEPAQPLWKDRMKLATRRVRLLALYSPDVLKRLQVSETKDREEAEALIKPATQPSTLPDALGTTKPATKPTTKPGLDADSEGFRINWKENLRGVKRDLLWDALVDARNNYYRDVNFRDLALGGLKGLEAVITTKGLEETFPGLGDVEKRNKFLAVIQERVAANKDAPATKEQLELLTTIKKIEAINKETVQLPDEVLVSEFADGAFAELDPFTSMIWPTDLDEFRKTTQGEFSGVGIQIQSDEDGSLKVVSPLEDSPAYKAGIKAGDVVTHINGKNAKGITLNQAVKTITGEKGTTVMLTIKSPDGSFKEHTIRRDTIKVASIKGWLHKPGGGWDWYVDPENKVAYLRMTNFTADTSKELDHAIETLQANGARGIILDLRYNPGGLLTAATEVCDKFLSDGVIVSTRPDRDTGNAPTVARAKKESDETDLPLIVLVNQYSASASEIVSGALKDQGRAVVVGERTFGKGSVQMLFPLADRSALLKLTTSHYYLPKGKCIHREENSQDWGVDPDVTVEMTPEQMRAAIDARQDLDILRDANSPPAQGEQEKLNDKAPLIEKAVAKKKDLLSSDPQLSAALLMLRLELSGGQAVLGQRG